MGFENEMCGAEAARDGYVEISRGPKMSEHWGDLI